MNNITKQELLSVLHEAYPLTIKMNKISNKYRKRNRPRLILFLYPLLVGFIIFLSKDIIPKALIKSPYLYVGLVIGWIVIFYLHSPMIKRNLVKEKEEKSDIENKFVEITGMHRRLCDKLKIELMIEGLENGVARDYEEALNYADDRYQKLLVKADEF